MEHIVVFMQENRAYDHYYGTLRGVRGFADRSAPVLPTNEPIWFQHANQSSINRLCGCTGCTIHWSPQGTGVRSLLEGLRCEDFVAIVKGGSPSVLVSEGELCSKMMADLATTTVYSMKVSNFITAPTECPADLKVHGIPKNSTAMDAAVSSSPVLTPTPSTNHTKGDADYILPFHLAFNRTSASCMGAPAMGYTPDTHIFNGGNMDSWNSARAPDFGMSYFTRR